MIGVNNLFVVRHGESYGNLAKKMSERGDDTLLKELHGKHTSQWPLTKKGIAQAQQAGVFLNKITVENRMIFDRMYVSSYARALQTAGYLDLIRSSFIVDPRIAERDWGDFDAFTDEERREKFGEASKMRKVEPYFWAPPNGESFNTLIIRIRDFVDSLSRLEVPNVIVVCHGEVMKALRIIFSGLTPLEYAEMEFSDDPLKRIRNCQIDHYSRRNPKTLLLERRLEWLQVYRPSETDGVAIPWQHLPQRRFDSSELLQMARKLSSPFNEMQH